MGLPKTLQLVPLAACSTQYWIYARISFSRFFCLGSAIFLYESGAGEARRWSR